MLDLARFQWISFDCYGTLVDWESGILNYLRPLLQEKNRNVSDAEILSLYSEIEPREQTGQYRPYREVLASVVRGFARELKFDITASQATGLAESIRDWQPFADATSGLKRLQARYKLAILSNIDDDLFAHSAVKLQLSFDCVVTAQQLGSYKPSLDNFKALLQRLGIGRAGLLHAAESLYHDVSPAGSLGIATVWVNRRQGKPAAATKTAVAQPDLEVSTIAELAQLTGC
jgi:2-haloacid dehalogenase